VFKQETRGQHTIKELLKTARTAESAPIRRVFLKKKINLWMKGNKYSVIVPIRKGNVSSEICLLKVKVNPFSVEKL
jgi:hypothetical protein